MLMTWLNKISGGIVQPWGMVYGVGTFSDPFTRQHYYIIAADGSIYSTQPNNAPQAIPLPAGVTVTGPVRFTQAFDRLLMHRGFSLPTLELTRISGTWQSIVQTPVAHEDDGTESLPNSEQSIFMGNRLLVLKQNDEISASDFGNYTRYLPVFDEFQINPGSADDLVAIEKFGETTLLGLKDHSVHAVYNVDGNLNALQQDQLTDEFGLVALRGFARVGNELWILSQLGVVSIEATDQGRHRIKSRVNDRGEKVPVRISAPLQPLFDRVNWQYAGGAVAARVGFRYYLALPVDEAESLGPELSPIDLYAYGTTVKIPVIAGRAYRFVKDLNETTLVNGTQTLTNSGDITAQSTTVTINKASGLPVTASFRQVRKAINNVIAVYDLENGAWSGWDEADNLSAKLLFTGLYQGRERLFLVTDEGYILLYEEDDEDVIVQPYTDLVLNSAPEPMDFDTIQVNGGTTITARTNAGDNTASRLGVASVFIGQNALWVDTPNEYGFYRYADVAAWSAPDTQPVKIPGGVRFYATNGVLPVVSIVFGDSDLGQWSVTYVKTQAIITTFVARAYAQPGTSRQWADRLAVNWQTSDPLIDLTLISPGVEETDALLTGVTRDRTKYYRPYNRPDFVETAINGDFNVPHRQDYSVVFGGSTTN